MTLTTDPKTADRLEVSVGESPRVPFVAPGRPGSLVEVKARYDNFIGGKWVAPVKGQYMVNVSPVNGKPFCEVAKSSCRGRGTRAGCRPCSQRRVG